MIREIVIVILLEYVKQRIALLLRPLAVDFPSTARAMFFVIFVMISDTQVRKVWHILLELVDAGKCMRQWCDSKIQALLFALSGELMASSEPRT
ncbi:hypothetical protein VTO58DRAFT_103862 [Aureobasidium pullulans]